ncbi:DJ-1/PfpI family protein [Streptomyces cocklensis]|jgi:putative intracellular protease/amidase|uniref:Isonitrile hydratase n=1 Tax=Actinacidiphila cocklensis TaxID=887465 RepID=A0A9W4GS63_9ACTN|nr:DJ-1/PfpI family protein [Actinacidiphila cocklensis]MDD1057144.1 DJ-1/PfpI family protein [Actinacidiphila cocklensis]WSX78306.1 DJ-1/PfpI family protein [Streptomyces sp. NBC_00899]CAG6395120.1 Isonitrile hydratase [Actinacidiphila cocklensis]
MQIAVLLYEGFTGLDVVGPYEILSRMPGAEVVFTAVQAGPVRTDMASLALTADRPLSEVTSPDMLVVPGGPGTEQVLADTAVLDWLRAADAGTTWTTSVCSGSLLLAAAGLLRGRRAASHWIALEHLPLFGAVPSTDRVVFDGKYATAAGVSAGIDLALHLAGRIAGDAVAEAIQLVVEYDPEPPYAVGSVAAAPPDLVASLRSTQLAVLPR